MNTKKENRILNHLVDINLDASSFYRSAAERAQSPNIEQTFTDLERLHKNIVENLEKRIIDTGAIPEHDGTIAGRTAQFFGELMSKVSRDVDETLVKHLEEAEDRCLLSIQEAMEEDEIHPDTKAYLLDEMSALQKSHNYMKSLKEYMRAT